MHTCQTHDLVVEVVLLFFAVGEVASEAVDQLQEPLGVCAKGATLREGVQGRKGGATHGPCLLHFLHATLKARDLMRQPTKRLLLRRSLAPRRVRFMVPSASRLVGDSSMGVGTACRGRGMSLVPQRGRALFLLRWRSSVPRLWLASPLCCLRRRRWRVAIGGRLTVLLLGGP